MRIGVDIDGVINDILSICVDRLNTFFGANLTTDDITDYEFAQSYNVSREKIVEFFIKEENNILREVQPQQEAAAVLGRLTARHEVILITARTAAQRLITEEWLKEHHISYDRLVTVGSNDKREACLREGIDILIEDRLENALMINSLGIPVLLMDAPYNQGELPDGIVRVTGWQDIAAKLQSDIGMVL
ncbi:MAG: hypothetical protein H0Z35_02990 [Thermoanaerobacteraceae bacterium]|nr:hypothetical protein [Thermoanaerobacteraceae bacterium]